MPLSRHLPAAPTCRSARRAAAWPALCAVLAGSVFAAPGTEAGAATDALARSTERFAERVVIPAHERLAIATAELVGAAAAFDADPDGTTLDAFREAWLRTAKARARGRAFAFGDPFESWATSASSADREPLASPSIARQATTSTLGPPASDR